MEKGIIYVYFNRAKYEKEGIEKYYVGQTIGTMEQRAGKDGKNYGWKDPSCNTKFARGIRKWGWDAFECRVLEEVYEEDLNELEKFYIEQFDSFENGYNSTLGGDGGNSLVGKSEEEMKEFGKKISEANKKRFESSEEREKISAAVKKCWKNQEYREKQSEKLSGEKSYKAKSVYCKELNIIFSYANLAKEYCKNVLNIKIGQIDRTCNGYRKSSGRLFDGTKLTWNWLEDVDQETLDKAEYIDSKKYEELLSRNVNDCK